MPRKKVLLNQRKSWVARFACSSLGGFECSRAAEAHFSLAPGDTGW
jgi:hypothetical protein